MAFRSRKLAKTLALAASCSSFVCPSQVSCVKQWALGDTERSDDKESLCMYPIRRFETNGIHGFFDVNNKFLRIDGVDKINNDTLKNININNVFPVKYVKSVSIGKDVILQRMCFKDFVSLENITADDRRMSTKLIRNKGEKGIVKYLRQNIDDLIPTSQRINNYAFGSSTAKSIKIPKNVTEIGDGVCKYCHSLSEVELPDSLLKIGNEAFYDCNALPSIRIPENVTEIGDGVFRYCRSLTEVELPDSLRKIGIWAFALCESLPSIKIPKNVTEIGEDTFLRCYSLTEVKLPDSLRKIGYSAFAGCKALPSITIPKNVTEIDDRAFLFCESLTKVKLPDSLRKIGNRAFCACKALPSIRIPKNVTEIGNYAFQNCDSLLTARVPRNAKIGQDAFPEATNVIIY